MKRFRALLGDVTGATAIEYGLIAALISVTAITAMNALGDDLSNSLQTITEKL